MHATASRGLGECAKWVPHFNFTRFEGGGGVCFTVFQRFMRLCLLFYFYYKCDDYYALNTFGFSTWR